MLLPQALQVFPPSDSLQQAIGALLNGTGPWPTVLAPGDALGPSYTPAGLVMPGLPGLYPRLSELHPSHAFHSRVNGAPESQWPLGCLHIIRQIGGGSQSRGTSVWGMAVCQGKEVIRQTDTPLDKGACSAHQVLSPPPYLNFYLGWRAAHSPSSLQHSPCRRKCGCHAWRRSVAVVTA